MKLTITSVDYAPEELHGQVPIELELVKIMPGPDRPDYWLGKTEIPIRWLDNNIEKHISHVIVSARWAGTQIDSNFKNLPIGIAYVTDVSLLEDEKVNFNKIKYIAIGMSSVGDGTLEKLEHIISGNIAPSFGLAQPSKKSKRLFSILKNLFEKDHKN